MHEQTEVCVYIYVCVMRAIFTGVCVRVCKFAFMYIYVHIHVYTYVYVYL